MYRTNKNKNSRGYSVDYRGLYGRDIFSVSNEDKFFEGDINQEENNFVNITSNSNNIKEKKKQISFQQVLEYMFKKSIKILVTSMIITIFIVLIAVIFGVVIEVEKREKLISYDNLIWPVVMQDPEPFSQEHPLNRETILKAGVWDASCQYRNDQSFFDKDGRQIILGQDVRDSIYKLFNINIDIKESIPDGVFFFNYDSLEDKFYVESISNDQCFIPHTRSYENIGNNLIKLTVEYLVPQNQFDGVMKVNNEKRIDKVMQYILKEDENTKNPYVVRVCFV